MGDRDIGLDYQNLFKRLLSLHFKTGYLRDKRIQQILGNFPLELVFSKDQLNRFILQDSPVLFFYRDEDNVRTVSAPHMISMMTSMLELTNLDKVLILGSKGGFLEAVIARATQQVSIIEEHDEVAAITEEAFIKLGMTNIWVQRSNPFMGSTETGLFDKILITGAIPYLPHQLIDQLAMNGILVMPLMLNSPEQQTIIQIRKKESELEIVNFGSVIFQPLYASEIPIFQKEIDFDFYRLLKIATESNHPDFITQKDFFEEFTKIIPKVEIEQIVFEANQQIVFQIAAQNEIENQKNENNKIENINIENEKNCPKFATIMLQLYLFNTEERSAKVQIEFFQTKLNNNLITDFLTIEGREIGLISVPFNVPLEEGSIAFSCKVLDVNKYRTSPISGFLHIFKSQAGWDLSLEFAEIKDETENNLEI